MGKELKAAKIGTLNQVIAIVLSFKKKVISKKMLLHELSVLKVRIQNESEVNSSDTPK